MTTRETDIGPEKLCSRCDEWWPADEEFFFADKTSKDDGLEHECRACKRERRLAREAAAGSSAHRSKAA